MAVYKNWPEICLLEPKNVPLMQALALACVEDGMEERLIRAFPEFFADQPVGGPVPLSLIKRVAAELAALPETESHEESDWYCACDELGIPIVACWRADGEYVMQDPLITRDELKDLRRQLRGRHCRAGCRVTWRGRECVVVGLTIAAVDDAPETTRLDDSTRIEAIYLAPVECIAVEH